VPGVGEALSGTPGRSTTACRARLKSGLRPGFCGALEGMPNGVPPRGESLVAGAPRDDTESGRSKPRPCGNPRCQARTIELGAGRRPRASRPCHQPCERRAPVLRPPRCLGPVRRCTACRSRRGPAQRCRTWTSNLLSVRWATTPPPCGARCHQKRGRHLHRQGRRCHRDARWRTQRCRTWTSNLLSVRWAAAPGPRDARCHQKRGRHLHRQGRRCHRDARWRTQRCRTWTSNLLSVLWATTPAPVAPGAAVAGSAWPRRVGPTEAPKESPGGPIGAESEAGLPRRGTAGPAVRVSAHGSHEGLAPRAGLYMSSGWSKTALGVLSVGGLVVGSVVA